MIGAEEHYRQLPVQQKSSKSSCRGRKIRVSSHLIVCQVQVKNFRVGKIFLEDMVSPLSLSCYFLTADFLLSRPRSLLSPFFLVVAPIFCP